MRPPRYPDQLRSAGRGGVARVRFVIDRDGSPVMSTFEVIESDDLSFAQAVRESLAGARYAPAERDGVTVAQVFDFAVDFGIGDAPPKIHDKNAMIVRALDITLRLDRNPMSTLPLAPHHRMLGDCTFCPKLCPA